MEFIISYFYGDNTHFKRSIPYVLAKGADLYPKECALFESEQKKGDLKIIYEPLPPRLLKLTGYEYLRLMVVIKAFRDLPTQDSIRRLVRICELLAIPQNHILVKSGQLIKKQIYTRTASDMKAEMAHELASLSRYIAWVKKVDDSNMVVKNKIRTFSVAERFEYNMDYMEILQRVIRETRELYCTRRDLIEEEIIKRQARWRGGVQSPPAEQAASQEVIGSSSKPKPPPSNIPSQTTPATQEPQEEKNLIYRSNFYLPDDKWTEGNIDGVRQFRRDGYYHIEINELYASIEPLKIPISDFRVCVDAEILKYVTSATCGICFRCIKEGDKHSYYLFAFSLKSYDLFLFRNGEYKFLTDYPPANFSGFKNINSLMVQMVGQEITLEMNGHILGTITDNNLILPGYIGLFVSKKENSPLEVRFRNFRLYSLE